MLPKYFALNFDRLYETPHEVDGHFRCVSGVHLYSVLRTAVEISVVFQRDVIL